jgi:uncharacterized coiled-coil DUF342 family protein
MTEQEENLAKSLNELITQKQSEIDQLKTQITSKKNDIKRYKKSLKDLNGKQQ